MTRRRTARCTMQRRRTRRARACCTLPRAGSGVNIPGQSTRRLPARTSAPCWPGGLVYRCRMHACHFCCGAESRIPGRSTDPRPARVRQGSQDLPQLPVLQPRARTGTAPKPSTRWSATRTGRTSAPSFPSGRRAAGGSKARLLRTRGPGENGNWTSSSEMVPEPVAFLDSGVGGLPVPCARPRHPCGPDRFVYVADRENFPYGEKIAGEIIQATLR